jgi:hypothetical protein
MNKRKLQLARRCLQTHDATTSVLLAVHNTHLSPTTYKVCVWGGGGIQSFDHTRVLFHNRAAVGATRHTPSTSHLDIQSSRHQHNNASKDAPGATPTPLPGGGWTGTWSGAANKLLPIETQLCSSWWCPPS